MLLFNLIYSIVMIVLFGLIFSIFWYERKTTIPAVPTLPWVRKKIIEALQARMDSRKTYQFAELGCGWGGINLDLAKSFPESDIIGYELSPFPYFSSKIRAKLCSKRIKIIKSSFFDHDLSGFDAIICYLSPWHMEKLKSQFTTLKAGSLIISNNFAIPDWEPVETLHTHVGVDIPIYVYKIG